MQMKDVEHKWTVQDIPSQEGRLAVVTGATSGVGFYTAKELARKRATVIMPARDMRKAKEAAERIEAEVPKARLYLADLDLAEFDSVREFGEHLRQRYGTGSLDLLVNNAGIMGLPKRTMNSQGLELQIATNYFGPFLLTALLFPLMKEEEGSRIVIVSSTTARSARLELEPVVTKSATVGRCLWDESERVTDRQFVVSAPSIGIHDRPCVVG
jgi:NAD(P)-dependent dehydrogenase (short-subunit alcohol dehydrogenase family)